MKAATMSTLGLYFIVVGVMSTLFGSYIIYNSLGQYASCSLSPVACQMTPTVYLHFLFAQSFGNTASFYGLLIVVIGSVLFMSAQSKIRVMVPKEEVIPAIAQTN